MQISYHKAVFTARLRKKSAFSGYNTCYILIWIKHFWLNFFINRPIFIKFKCSLLITESSLLLKSPCKFSFLSVFPVFSGLFCAFERISLRERPEGGWRSANEKRFLPSEAGEKTRLRRALSGRHSGQSFKESHGAVSSCVHLIFACAWAGVTFVRAPNMCRRRKGTSRVAACGNAGASLSTVT